MGDSSLSSVPAAALPASNRVEFDKNRGVIVICIAGEDCTYEIRAENPALQQKMEEIARGFQDKLTKGRQEEVATTIRYIQAAANESGAPASRSTCRCIYNPKSNHVEFLHRTEQGERVEYSIALITATKTHQMATEKLSLQVNKLPSPSHRTIPPTQEMRAPMAYSASARPVAPMVAGPSQEEMAKCDRDLTAVIEHINKGAAARQQALSDLKGWLQQDQGKENITEHESLLQMRQWAQECLQIFEGQRAKANIALKYASDLNHLAYLETGYEAFVNEFEALVKIMRVPDTAQCDRDLTEVMAYMSETADEMNQALTDVKKWLEAHKDQARVEKKSLPQWQKVEELLQESQSQLKRADTVSEHASAELRSEYQDLEYLKYAMLVLNLEAAVERVREKFSPQK